MFLKNLLTPSEGGDAFFQEASSFNVTVVPDLCEEILNQGVDLRIRVTGQSMRPALNSNDVVTVKKVSIEKLRIGDLILIKSNSGQLILHRLIKKERYVGRTVYRTKGDSLMAPDIGISADRILGKVCIIEKLRKSRNKSLIINLESIPGQIFHSAMILLQFILFFRQCFRVYRKPSIC